MFVCLCKVKYLNTLICLFAFFPIDFQHFSLIKIHTKLLKEKIEERLHSRGKTICLKDQKRDYSQITDNNNFRIGLRAGIL